MSEESLHRLTIDGLVTNPFIFLTSCHHQYSLIFLFPFKVFVITEMGLSNLMLFHISVRIFHLDSKIRNFTPLNVALELG